MEDFVAIHKNMVHPINSKLDTNFYGSTFVNELIVSIIARANLSTMDGE
jgi:hypothetical protein